MRAIFFDWDHTLQNLDVAYPQALQAAWAPVCEPAGVSVATLRRMLDAAWPAWWQALLAGEVRPDALYSHWFAEALEEVGCPLPSAEVAERAAAYEAAFEQHLELYDDVLPTLQDLRANHPNVTLGILTNGPSERQRRRIARWGLEHWVPHCVISEEVGSRKPDAPIFEFALASAQVAPAEAVMVGDDPVTDMGGAQGAGLGAVWLNRLGRPWPAHLPPPDGTLAGLSSLTNWLRRL